MTRSLTTRTNTTSRDWQSVLDWVTANRKLIRQVASPYYLHMAADIDDLTQEAVIAAFKAKITCHKKGVPEKFIPYFRVVFKTCCIRLASGIQTVHCLEDYLLPHTISSHEDQPPSQPESLERIELALQVISNRQQEVCLWVLEQPLPVSTPDIARRFNITKRHACRIVSNSIQKISVMKDQ